MDQKKLLVIVAVVILLLLGVGAYTMMNQSGQPSGDSNVNTNAADQDNDANGEVDTDGAPVATDSGSKSIFDLMSAAGAKKCTFNINQNGSAVQSIAYINNGMMRTDATVNSGGTEQKVHMIMDGKTAYTWIDGMGTGFKMDIQAMKNQAPAGIAGTSPAPDFNQKVDYQCEAWSVDNSLLAPPTSIQFMSFSQPAVK